jgi:glutamyl-tRNA synthetase
MFNPVIIDFYEQVGYLPDAILNYLVLIGWSYDDKTEDFTRQQMIDLFSLERVNKAAASFDAKKLFAFQERQMGALPLADKVERVLPFLTRAGLVTEPATSDVRQLVSRVVADAGPRIVVAGDILDYDFFFLPDDRVAYDEKAVEKHLRKPPAPTLLPKLRAVVASAEPLDAAMLKTRVEDFAQAEAVKPGPVSQMLRVATTGKEVGFGTYETLAILGRERCLARIDRAKGLV